ncbi:MAG: hypothetical protein HW386_1368 [Gammaproteobacteria bacterium]|nr:hypothetical protein [Gammaproteobacteria bacterium]
MKLPGFRVEDPDRQGIMMTGYRVDPLLAEAVDYGAACVQQEVA